MRLVKVTWHGEEYEKSSEKVKIYAVKAKEAFEQVAWEQDPEPQVGSQWTLVSMGSAASGLHPQELVCAAPPPEVAEGACDHKDLCNENLGF